MSWNLTEKLNLFFLLVCTHLNIHFQFLTFLPKYLSTGIHILKSIIIFSQAFQQKEEYLLYKIFFHIILKQFRIILPMESKDTILNLYAHPRFLNIILKFIWQEYFIPCIRCSNSYSFLWDLNISNMLIISWIGQNFDCVSHYFFFSWLNLIRKLFYLIWMLTICNVLYIHFLLNFGICWR